MFILFRGVSSIHGHGSREVGPQLNLNPSLLYRVARNPKSMKFVQQMTVENLITVSLVSLDRLLNASAYFIEYSLYGRRQRMLKRQNIMYIMSVYSMFTTTLYSDNKNARLLINIVVKCSCIAGTW